MACEFCYLRDEDHENADDYNFDHPDALDFDLAYEKLNELIEGKDVEIPCYDFATHKRTKEVTKIKTASIIVLEGIHTLSEQRFRHIMDLKIFVLTPDDIRLARRIERDIKERGRTVVDVLAQYNRFVKPAYDDFIRPTMKFADIIIPFENRNENAVEMLIQNLKIRMNIYKLEMMKARTPDTSQFDCPSPATTAIQNSLRKENSYLSDQL